MEEEEEEAKDDDPKSTRKEFISKFNKNAEPTMGKRKWVEDGWGRGGYMKAKVQKLEEQCTTEKKSNIFNGISIWVNGYTNPSSDELKKLICAHGGNYVYFFSKTHVTHVIATNLPDSKIKNLKKNDKVVHPNWIVDSVENSKLLPEDKYLLYSVAKRDGNVINFQSKQRISRAHNDYSLHEENLSSVIAGGGSGGGGDDGGGDGGCGGNDDENEELCDLKSPNLFDSGQAEVLKSDDHSLPEENLSFVVDSGGGADDIAEEDKSEEQVCMKSPDLFDSGQDNISDCGLDCNSIPVLTKHSYSETSTSTTALKAGDKNYIKEFYAHSRLHHLSMWKAELKKFTSSIQEKWKSKSTTKERNVNNNEKLIMHVDMDSFFATVALKMNPELKGKPIAVCHSGRNTSGSDSWSEIASCDYEARSYGLHNGMLLKNARIRCPQLVCVPYQFDQYREISQKFYEIISKFTCQVEAVSCDEVLVDISELIGPCDDVLELADTIRREVFAATGCTVSCGIGNSILIARLATRSAKPDGRCYIPREEIGSFILTQSVENLPGIGYSTSQKLNTLNIKTCGDLQNWAVLLLQKEFGQKFGEKLYKFARGIDAREIKTVTETKSISAEINYGMRFTKNEEVERFVKDLSLEIEKRLKENKKKGKHLTLKIMIARKGTSAPSKYMGHGICDSSSKSVTLPFATDDAKIIGETCVRIMRLLKIAPQDYRGIGIQMSKLSDSTMNESLTISSLVQFAKPVTAEELFERDKRESAVKASPKKNVTLNDFKRTTSASLTNLKVDSASSGNVSHQNRYGTLVTDMQASSTDWDPQVLEELPEYIRNELLEHQTRMLSARSSKYSPSKINVETSPSSHNKPIKIKKSPSARKSPSKRNSPSTNKSPSSRKSPSKRKGNQKKLTELMGNTKISFPKTEKHLQVREGANAGPSSAVNRYTPVSLINLEVVNELPDDVRSEVLSQINKSSNAPLLSSKSCVVIDVAGGNQVANKLSSKQPNLWANEILLSPSQLDQSVLQALPQHIREDVINNAEKVKSNRSLMIQKSSKDEACTIVSSRSIVTHSSTDNTMRLTPTTTSIGGLGSCKNIVSESIDDDLSSKCESSKADTSLSSSSCVTVMTEQCKSSSGPCPTDDQLLLLSADQSKTQSGIALIESKTIHDPDSLPNLDQSVFNALPDDIRKEILSDANFCERRAVSSACNTIADNICTASSCSSSKLTVITTNSSSLNKTKSTNFDVLLSPSQIDINVLNVLPASIRHEVMAAAKAGKQKKLRLKENELREQQTAELAKNNETMISQNVMVKQNMPMLYGTNTCLEIKKMLRNWVDTYPEPLSEDLSEIIDYFHQLLISLNMESLYSLVLFLRRIVSSRSLWHTAFNEVLQSVQGEIKSLYSGTFPISPFQVAK